MMYRYNEFDERRVVIYARVSTEHEAQISALSNQLEWYQQYLDHHPEWNLIDRYIDEGITGTSAEKRPGFTQMIADAKAHKFDLIITREVSRFARNTEETLHFTKMLRRIGVEVFFINDNIKTFDGDGELRLTIMASLAQDESRKTSIRVKSGQQISMEKGVFYGNGNILGYDRVEKIVEGNKKQVDFNINPVQAETVRRIFDMYLEGHGLMAIKNEMERTGRKTATGLPNWHCTGISQTLKNSFYCGIITYHKEYTPDFLVQKKVKNYGEMALTQVQGRHEPIITVEEYERVQKIMKSKTGKLKNPTTGRRLTGVTPPKTVWGRLMICSCGRRFNRRKWRTNANGEKFFGYQCYGTTQTGTIKSRLKRGLPIDGICQSPMIAEWKLQMMANYIFRHFLTNKQKVLEIANSLLEEHIGDTEVQVQDNSKLIEQKQRELDRANTKRRNLIDLLSNCDITREDYQEARADVDRQIDKLKEEIEALTPVVEETEEEAIDYESKITVLRYALEQYTNFDTEGDIPESVIEAFVEKIEVSKDCFKWYLRGDFGGDSPIPMNVDGNRKKGATISPQYIIPPANFGDSGSYQRKQVMADFIKQIESPPKNRWGFLYLLQRDFGNDIIYKHDGKGELQMKYVKTQKYDSELIKQKIMGPNPLKLEEELMTDNKIKTGSIVMDLGSGQGITSVFLAKEYGFKVYATDLWSEPEENQKFFAEMGLTEEEIVAVKADATDLKYEKEFFDAVVSTDSYNYFGRDVGFLDEKLLPFVKKDGYIYIVVPGMKKDCHDNIPEELLLSWSPEQLDYIHDIEYWENIISKSKNSDVISICEMESNEECWNDWLQCDNEYAINDRKAIEAGACKYLNFIAIVLKKK